MIQPQVVCQINQWFRFMHNMVLRLYAISKHEKCKSLKLTNNNKSFKSKFLRMFRIVPRFGQHLATLGIS